MTVNQRGMHDTAVPSKDILSERATSLPDILDDTISSSESAKDAAPELEISKESGVNTEYNDLIVEDITEKCPRPYVDDSIYPEVRASVPPFDDPSMPQSTVRMWTLALVMCTLGSAINMLFSMHNPPLVISSYVTSMIAWPLGRAWEKYVPNVRLFGKRGPYLNPGPFNMKEHTLITVMGAIAFGDGNAYATDILLSMQIPHFYNKEFGWAFDLFAVWSTQCIGFAFAGLCNKVLVNPPSMIWPSTLVTSTFLTNIHVKDNHVVHGWKISRLAFFFLVFACGVIWYWVPGFLFQGLSTFGWITWIKPKSVLINQIFGVSTGLGLIPTTLDWNQIAGYIGSPLIPPVSAILTIGLSMVTIFWIIVPIIHYSNVWYGKYVPVSSSVSYDRFQDRYNVTKVMSKKLSLDEEAYSKYSPLYLSTTFAMSYGLSFASISSSITHAIFFHGKEIVQGFRKSRQEGGDVHNRLMREYDPVPHWWYVIVLLVFLPLSIAAMRAWPTEMPVWALLFALGIAAFFLMPVGIIYAITNIKVGLNVISEFIIGYLVPGRPVAMMFFKTYGYISNMQALLFVNDMKLGHYMKIAPKVMFSVQLIGTLWGSTVQLLVMKWAKSNVEGICTRGQTGNFTCPGATVFFNASIIWGVIGPARMFSKGKLYASLNYFFLAGAILPIVNWLIINRWPKRLDRFKKYPQLVAANLFWPVFFSGTGLIPPATPFNYSVWCIVGICFGYYVRKMWFDWWVKYNYSLSAALDVGLAVASLLIFFAITLPNKVTLNWWGNTIVDGGDLSTLDAQGKAIQHILKPGETFGPDSW